MVTSFQTYNIIQGNDIYVYIFFILKYDNDIHVYACKINQLPVLCPSIPGDQEHFRYISAPDASVCIHGISKVNYNGLIINSLSELPAWRGRQAK